MMNIIKYTLDYQELLILLAQALGLYTFDNSYKNKFITTKRLCDYLKSVQTLMRENGVMLIIPSRKVVSNEMARLYRMGFLSRRAVPRKVKTKSGKIVNRGIEYQYSFTKQGMKYLAYLIKNGSGSLPEELDPELEVILSKMRKEGEIKSYENEIELREMTKLMWKIWFKEKDDGKIKVFTPKGWSPANKKLIKILDHEKLIKNINIEQAYEFRDENEKLKEKIKELEEELEKKNKEIERLQGELKKCKEKKENKAFNMEQREIAAKRNYSISFDKKPVKKSMDDFENTRKKLEEYKGKHAKDINKEPELTISMKISDDADSYEKASIMWAARLLSTLSLEIKKSGIIIRWIKPQNFGKKVEYVIFKNGKEYARVSSDKEWFLDKDVQENESYEYYVRAIVGNSYSDSPKIQVTYKKENEGVVYTPFDSHHSVEWSIHHPEDLDI